jgi:hypothetical protein
MKHLISALAVAGRTFQKTEQEKKKCTEHTALLAFASALGLLVALG